MKQLISTLLIALCLFTPTFAKENYPRQKITLTGTLLPNVPKNVSVKDLENLQKPIAITIFDPYNKNIETIFYGFYLKEFSKAYAQPEYKIMRVGAIDGYKVDIPKAEVEGSNLFISYKDKTGYLTVDRMGPARIIGPVKGIINKDLLLKIGVYWVWQVKTVEFLK